MEVFEKKVVSEVSIVHSLLCFKWERVLTNRDDFIAKAQTLQNPQQKVQDHQYPLVAYRLVTRLSANKMNHRLLCPIKTKYGIFYRKY